MQNNLIVYVYDKNKQSQEVIKSFLENSGLVSEVKLFEDYSMEC